MMKRIFLLFLFSLAVPGDPAAASNTTEVIQPFSSVLWTTTTLHSPGGKTFIFTRRTLYTRDALGTTRREMHQPTKGLQHDTTAALERVLIGTTSAQAVSGTRSRNETLVEDVDLGTLKFSGLPASGRRQSFQDASGQRTRTVETWFCATLGTTVHTESSNAHGDITVSDLSDLHLGNPVPVASEMTPANPPAVPLLHLYQGLFGLVANMERDRQANDSNRKVNMDEIEDHLRKQVNLSTREWQLLVAKSVDVQKYTLDLAKQARVLIDREHAARQQGLASGGTWADAHGKLHSMQQDLNTHVQGEIDTLEATIGPAGTEKIRTYLNGPLAASTSVVPSSRARSQPQREQVR